MPIVERAHQPRKWTGFRATREQFVEVVDKIESLVQAEAKSRATAYIEIAAYERAIEGTDEFLESVEERDWIQLDEVDVTISAYHHEGGLGALIVGLSINKTGIRMTMRGGDRRARNAIETDIVEAIERRVSMPSQRTTFLQYVYSWWVAGLLIGAAGIVLSQTHLTHHPHRQATMGTWGTIFLLLGIAILIGFLMVGLKIRENAWAALPAAEFLPDEGTTRWQTWQRVAFSRAKVAGYWISLIAAIAAIATVVVAVA